jgi:hypothetical protein
LSTFIDEYRYNAIERREGSKGGKDTSKKVASSNAHYKVACASSKTATPTTINPKCIEISTPQAAIKSEFLFLKSKPVVN